MAGTCNTIVQYFIVAVTVLLAVPPVNADDPCTSCSDQPEAIGPGDEVGSTALICFSDYCSTYGQSRTHNISVDPGTYSFEVDVAPCSQGTEWYVNGTYQGSSANDCGCTDPGFNRSFSSGTTIIEAVVYYAPDCPGGSWTYEETHRWNVTIGQPDLTRETSSISKRTVVPSESISVEVVVKNIGSASANAGSLYYYWERGSRSYTSTYRVGSDSYPSLAPGATSRETFNFTIPSNASPGSDYFFYYFVDATNTTIESDGGNNKFYWSMTVDPPPKPDLIVEDISTSPSNPVAGQSTTITARMKNQGDANSPAFDIRYTINGSSIGTDRVSFGLTVGQSDNESISYTFPSSCSSQTYNVCVVADSSSEVGERNEGNNQRCENFTVDPAPSADLIVQDKSQTPSPCYVGEACTIEAIGCNVGNVNALTTIKLEYRVEGQVVGSDTFSLGLFAGQCDGESASFTPSVADDAAQVCITIDPDNRVTECREDNNTRCENFVIVRAPTRFRGNNFVDKTTMVGVPIRLEAKLEKDSGLHPDIAGEPIYFEILTDGAWQTIPDDGVTLCDLTTDANGIGCVYYLPPEPISPSPPTYPIRAVYDGNQSLDSTFILAELTIDSRGWSVDPLPFSSEKIPLVLVHGNNSEGEPDARWSTFLDRLSDNPQVFDQFDVYNWVHDSSAAIGFDGVTGNAADLQDFIYKHNGGLLAYYPPGTKVLFVAHSRGGLVVRSFMNQNNHGDDVLGLIALGTPHHGSPFAVPDWTGYTWASTVGTGAFARGCFNALVNTEGAFVAFDVDRLGDLSLAWDNDDGKIAGHLPELFDVDIATDGALQLTPQDCNRTVVTPDATVFFSTVYKQYAGTLADLNLREAYYSKIVAFAAYDDDLSDNSRFIEGWCGLAMEARSDAEMQRAAGLISEHWKLENVIPLLASMSEIGAGSAVYYANDGLVPLQSALLLDISGGAVFSSIDGAENVSVDDGAINGNRLVRSQHIFSGAQDGIRDHVDLLDTENGAYWQALADEIAGFIEGDILVDTEPDSLDATWTLTGPNTQLSGPGDLQIEHALPGQYTIEWDEMPLWVTPSPNPDTKSLLAGGSLVFLGRYEREPGLLEVQITPPEANDDGAMWRLNAGPDTEWHLSGVQITVPTGEYTLEFLEINCWDAPDPQVVTIDLGQWIANGHYSPVDCSWLDGDCVAGVCDRENGTCVTEPTNEGGFCTDDDPCTEADVCSNGACVGVAIDCTALDNDCNVGICNTDTGGCEAQPVNEGGACDDGDMCTGGDTCTAGVCGGAPIDCSSLDDDCNIGVCNMDTGVCEAEPINEGGACDDGNLCTDGDSCTAGVCAGTPIDCAFLDDDCNVGMCDPDTGMCEARPANEGGACDDEDACTTGDACDADGNCLGTPVNPAAFCDAENTCTIDTCDPDSGCVNTPDEGASCDDGNACTIDDSCDVDGNCLGTPDEGASCDDGNACTTDDTCDASGNCGGAPDDGTPCDDGNTCTIDDSCDVAGNCVGTPDEGALCDDGNTCTTDDTCDASGDCVGTPHEGASCDDGNACTTADACDADGNCVGTPVNPAAFCDDENTCTIDTCDREIGCVNTPDEGASCDDEDACTTGDLCQADGNCVGTPIDPATVCDDENACTIETCDPDSGCVNTPVDDGTTCDNGQFCDGTDTCVGGDCVVGEPPCENECCETTRSCGRCPDPPRPDRDGDGVLDAVDNCPDDANSDQADIDNDDVGDICDNCPNDDNTDLDDADGDDVGNVCDNCPEDPNTDQADDDDDGVGDECDGCPNDPNKSAPEQCGCGNVETDTDGDGTADCIDNCPNAGNPAQADSDTDGLGDPCDNCPDEPNADQTDSDGDGTGNVCDNCPNDGNSEQADSDRDSRGDTCDNCPNDANANQTDTDDDGVGDVCDNCSEVVNPGQADCNADGIGDRCDFASDCDSDGVPDAEDNCPREPNPGQEDANGNGVGDACEDPPPVQPLCVSLNIAQSDGGSETLVGRLATSFVADATLRDIETDEENIQDVTEDATWTSDCGTIDNGEFTAPMVCGEKQCVITASYGTGADRCNDSVEVTIIPNPRDQGLCGAGCGCTPGAPVVGLIFLGLLSLRFVGPGCRGRGRRRM